MSVPARAAHQHRASPLSSPHTGCQSLASPDNIVPVPPTSCIPHQPRARLRPQVPGQPTNLIPVPAQTPHQPRAVPTNLMPVPGQPHQPRTRLRPQVPGQPNQPHASPIPPKGAWAPPRF